MGGWGKVQQVGKTKVPEGQACRWAGGGEDACSSCPSLPLPPVPFPSKSLPVCLSCAMWHAMMFEYFVGVVGEWNGGGGGGR